MAAARSVSRALFVLIAGQSAVVPSVQQLDAFQDSGNPGYFLIKVALWIMAAAILCQSLVDIFRSKAFSSEVDTGSRQENASK